MRVFSKNLIWLLLLAVVSGVFAFPVYSQGWRRMNNRAGRATAKKTTTRKQSYNNNYSNQNTNSRATLSYSTQPMAENSFYPIVRQNGTNSYENYVNSQSEWSDLGNGAIIRHGTNLTNNNAAQENKLSPEVLETIRQLKAEYSEPEKMYQMSATNQADNNRPTPKKPNGLLNPNASDEYYYEKNKNNQGGIEIQSSYLTFPQNKNIRIKSLDFRQTDVADALRSLARLININLMLGDGVGGKTVTVLFNDVTMEEAFNTILVNFGLSFSWEGKILRIFPSNAAPTFTRIFNIQHANATEIQPMLNKLLSEKGK